MHSQLLAILRCPECLSRLTVADALEEAGQIASGTLTCDGCSRDYPIIRSIRRFVPANNYASNFGFQWNEFRRTQLDSYTGVPISRERLFSSTEWSPEELKGKHVLDVGCGAGRFTEVMLEIGAHVVALDYSSAVEACFANFGAHPHLNVVQGDVYKLPFQRPAFDYVYCLGVLQHTPDVKRAFMCLPDQVQPGGKLAVDIYPRLLLNVLWPKYWLRPITKRMDARRLFRMVQRVTPVLLPMSDLVNRLPLAGRKLRYAIPVVNHGPAFPDLTRQQVYEWAVLDTFDMLSPAYDRPQSAATLETWFREAGFRDVKVFRKGQIIGHGVR